MATRDYKKDLLSRLKDKKYAANYLKGSLDETIKDGDMVAFLLSLKDVIEANSSVSSISQKTRVSRQHLHSLLSTKNKNPTLCTLNSILEVLGLSLDFSPKK